MSAFETAAEFFEVEEADPATVESRETPRAKGIVWYSPVTPIFACEEHARVLAPLRFADGGGDADPDTVAAIRQQAYRWLLGDGPTCDACAGRLREVIDSGD